MSAKFDEFPSSPFQDIKEKPKRHGRTDAHTEGKTDGRTDGQRENSITGGRGYNYSDNYRCQSVKQIRRVFEDNLGII